MHFGEIYYYAYLVIDGNLHLIHYGLDNPDTETQALEVLRNEYAVAPNWEAALIRGRVVRRQSQLTLQICMPFEPLYDVRTQIYDDLIDVERERMQRGIMADRVELPARNYPTVVGFSTYERNIDAQWQAKAVPVARAVNATNPNSLGVPGGPCHIIRDIQDERLSPQMKQELIEDVEKGRDLSNSDAGRLYKPVSMTLKNVLFPRLYLTSHAQYRMNLRGVTTNEIKMALSEFDRWYQARMANPDKTKPQDQRIMQSLAYGETVKFEAKRLGLTVVFTVDSRKKHAVLVSTWWTGWENPSKPAPGQCEFIPFYDQDRGVEDRPAILANALRSLHASVTELEASYYSDEMYLLPDDFEEALEDDFLTASQLDPARLYERSPEEKDQRLFDLAVPVPGYDDDVTHDSDEIEAGEDVDSATGNTYYRNRPVNPRNRQKNRNQRLKYRRNPGKKRRKNLQEKRYRRNPRTKMLRKRQKMKRKQRGR